MYSVPGLKKKEARINSDRSLLFYNFTQVCFYEEVFIIKSWQQYGDSETATGKRIKNEK